VESLRFRESVAHLAGGGIGVEYKFEELVVELAEFRLVADGLPERRPVRLGRPTSPTAITASS
jgi:hypothetical protein